MKKILMILTGFFSTLFFQEKKRRKKLENIIKREKEGSKIVKENKDRLEEMAINDLVYHANGLPVKSRKSK